MKNDGENWTFRALNRNSGFLFNVGLFGPCCTEILDFYLYVIKNFVFDYFCRQELYVALSKFWDLGG